MDAVEAKPEDGQQGLGVLNLHGAVPKDGLASESLREIGHRLEAMLILGGNVKSIALTRLPLTGAVTDLVGSHPLMLLKQNQVLVHREVFESR